jgi:hypothetical protein
MRGNNPIIERLLRAVIRDRAGEREPLRHAAGLKVPPEVDIDELARSEEPCGLLAHLADDSLEQRLARLDMSGGLIDDQLAVDAFFDDEKATVSLRYGGDGDLRVGHGRIIRTGGPGDLQAQAAPD